MIECKDLQQHYEAFALGALEGEELAEIRIHLERGCPACASGVEQARAVVAQLAYLSPGVRPPDRVKRKLMASVAAKHRPARSWSRWVAWGAAAAMLAVAVIAARQSWDLEHQIAELNRQYRLLVEETDSYRRVLAIISAPETQTVSLAAPDSPQIQAYWNESQGLILAGQNVPVPSNDRTFQLWIVPTQGNPISVDIFRPDPSGRALLISAPDTPIADAAALAISDEPAGGSAQPTTTPIWVGPLG